MRSLPSRECGLKLLPMNYPECPNRVTPFAGVWIEIWIESNIRRPRRRSLPSRECGLKSDREGVKRLRSRRHSLRGSVD